MRTTIVGWLIGLSLTACGAGLREAPLVPATTPPAPFVLNQQFSSDVPDDYYVFTGPAQSYDRFRVNERLRGALEEYARRKTGPAGTETAIVRVHLVSVKTRYDQLGASLRPRRLPGLALADFDSYQEDVSIPIEITKEVDLTASVEVLVGDRSLRKETFTVTSSETIDRDHYDRWAYGYSGVFNEALRLALKSVDRVVTEVLAVRAKA